MAGEHKTNNSGNYTGTYYHSKQWYQDGINDIEKNYIKPHKEFEAFSGALNELADQLDYASTDMNNAKNELKDWLTIDGKPIAGNKAKTLSNSIKEIKGEVSELISWAKTNMKELETYKNGVNAKYQKQQWIKEKARAKTYLKGYTGD